MGCTQSTMSDSADQSPLSQHRRQNTNDKQTNNNNKYHTIDLEPYMIYSAYGGNNVYNINTTLQPTHTNNSILQNQQNNINASLLDLEEIAVVPTNDINYNEQHDITNDYDIIHNDDGNDVVIPHFETLMDVINDINTPISEPSSPADITAQISPAKHSKITDNDVADSNNNDNEKIGATEHDHVFIDITKLRHTYQDDKLSNDSETYVNWRRTHRQSYSSVAKIIRQQNSVDNSRRATKIGQIKPIDVHYSNELPLYVENYVTTDDESSSSSSSNSSNSSKQSLQKIFTPITAQRNITDSLSPHLLRQTSTQLRSPLSVNNSKRNTINTMSPNKSTRTIELSSQRNATLRGHKSILLCVPSLQTITTHYLCIQTYKTNYYRDIVTFNDVYNTVTKQAYNIILFDLAYINQTDYDNALDVIQQIRRHEYKHREMHSTICITVDNINNDTIQQCVDNGINILLHHSFDLSLSIDNIIEKYNQTKQLIIGDINNNIIEYNDYLQQNNNVTTNETSIINNSNNTAVMITA